VISGQPGLEALVFVGGGPDGVVEVVLDVVVGVWAGVVGGEEVGFGEVAFVGLLVGAGPKDAVGVALVAPAVVAWASPRMVDTRSGGLCRLSE
jgi:hypothetical protein